MLLIELMQHGLISLEIVNRVNAFDMLVGSVELIALSVNVMHLVSLMLLS